MRKQLILAVDDEVAILRLIRATLLAAGFSVTTAERGEEALILFNNEHPDLILLDLMLPGMDGFEVLRRVREHSRVAVIMLTARSGDMDKLRGLESGADDYLTKPFNPDEVVARVRAVLRRTSGDMNVASEAILHYPELEIDLERRRVIVKGDEVRLSRTEWELLSQLGSNAGRVMMHAELLTRIWGPEFRNETHYLRTWVSRLRSKLEPDEPASSLITTFSGIGYRMETPQSQDN